MDSFTGSDNQVLDSVWKGRRAIARLAIATGPPGQARDGFAAYPEPGEEAFFKTLADFVGPSTSRTLVRSAHGVSPPVPLRTCANSDKSRAHARVLAVLRLSGLST